MYQDDKHSTGSDDPEKETSKGTNSSLHRRHFYLYPVAVVEEITPEFDDPNFDKNAAIEGVIGSHFFSSESNIGLTFLRGRFPVS